MSENVQFTEVEERRWKIWVEGKDRGLTDEEIAKKIGFCSRTIRRLKEKARETGAYQEWIESIVDWSQEEFKELHKVVKEKEPLEAYKLMCRIIEKSLVEKMEHEVSGAVTFIYKGYGIGEKKPKSAEDRDRPEISASGGEAATVP